MINCGFTYISPRTIGNTHYSTNNTMRRYEVITVPKISELFDMSKTSAAKLFESCTYPWEVLPLISEFITKLGHELPEDEYDKLRANVWISKSAKVAPSAYIAGPCIIEAGAEIRYCAYIRGSALIGKDAVVGNSCEIKNSILFSRVQVPHFNYVGDSVLGFAAHMGAGAVTSNVKSDKSLVTVNTTDEKIKTGLKKCGAMLGDFVEVGCNSVLCPGSVVGKNSVIYPLSMVRGVIPENSIFKDTGNIVAKR